MRARLLIAVEWASWRDELQDKCRYAAVVSQEMLEGTRQAEAQLSPAQSWWQRLLAFFAAIWAWLTRLVSQLFGGGSSSSDSLAASA